jgi:hypothetical protein
MPLADADLGLGAVLMTEVNSFAGHSVGDPSDSRAEIDAERQ